MSVSHILWPVVITESFQTFSAFSVKYLSFVAFKYLNMCFILVHCSSVRSYYCCESLITTRLRSGLVQVVKLICLHTLSVSSDITFVRIVQL